MINCLSLSFNQIHWVSMKKFYTLFFLSFFLVILSSEATSRFLDFDLWPYHQEGCMNTQDQFLKKTSTIRVEFEKLNNNDCHVISGRWVDYFTNEKINNAQDVIIAPVIPLGHIKKLAPNWPFQKLLAYVHYSSLFITFKKGDSEKKYLDNIGSLKHIPKHNAYKCGFIGMWMDAKSIWSIPFLPNEEKLLAEMAKDCITPPQFNRIDLFGTWMRVEGHKCSTRIEVLKRDSQIETVPLPGHEHKKCTSRLTGSWIDPYTDFTHLNAKELDIDHIVPLKHSYITGAWKWPKWRRKKYSNFQVDPFHLLAISYTENRKKLDKHPGKYMPPLIEYHCEYLKNWIGIKWRWGLKIIPDEKTFLNKNIINCHDQINTNEFLEIIEILSSINLLEK